MNTQIGEYFQITTSKPIVKSVSSSQMEDLKGKFFKVRVSNDKIVFTEGVKENILKEFSWSSEDLLALHDFARGIKEQNPKEKSIVVKSKVDVKYKDLVKVVDAVQKKVEFSEGVKGKTVLRPLYENLAFEKMR